MVNGYSDSGSVPNVEKLTPLPSFFFIGGYPHCFFKAGGFEFRHLCSNRLKPIPIIGMIK